MDNLNNLAIDNIDSIDQKFLEEFTLSQNLLATLSDPAASIVLYNRLLNIVCDLINKTPDKTETAKYLVEEIQERYSLES